MQTLKKVIALLLISFCVETNADDEEFSYKIATDASYPPFSFQKDGELLGIEIDLLSEISRRSNLKFHYVIMNFDGVIPALLSNQVDAALDGITVTPLRKRVLDFSDPYYTSSLCVVTHVDNYRINTVNDLKHKKVAVKRGSYAMEFVEQFKDEYELDVQYYKLSPDIVVSVRNKTSDLFIADEPTQAYLIKAAVHNDLKIVISELYGKTYYAFAVKKGKHQDLLKVINKNIKEIIEDGTMQKIVNDYI